MQWRPQTSTRSLVYVDHSGRPGVRRLALTPEFPAPTATGVDGPSSQAARSAKERRGCCRPWSRPFPRCVVLAD